MDLKRAEYREVMITEDNEATANTVARGVEIERAIAEIAMGLSSIMVVTNANLLRGVRV